MFTRRSRRPAAAKPRRRRVVGWVLVGLVLLCAGLYAGAYALTSEKVPRGTTVAGVAIGGLTQHEAMEKLRRRLDAAEGPIRVRVAGSTTRVDPRKAGLAVDYAASVAQVSGGSSWSPEWLWHYLTGGEHVEAVVTVDEERMNQLLARLEKKYGTKPRNGRIRFHGGEVRVRQPRPAAGLDQEAARRALREAYLTGERVTLQLVRTPPEIDRKDVQQALEQFARPAVSGPVTITFEDVEVTLSPAQLTRALRVRTQQGEPTLALRPKRLHQLMADQLGPANEPEPATVRLVNGEPQVVPGEPAVSYDHQRLEKVFLDLVTRPEGKRQVEVPAQTVQPDFTVQDAKDLGIVEQVSSFTTTFPHAHYRNVNLSRAAELIDGTVLKPGEIFSLNEVVGERTRANGFTAGTIIKGGVYVEALGGGVSQVATTVFNAMYFAGLEDIEHHPHSFYISRYPVGREATVYWGVLDLRFRNNTEYGVLIDAEVDKSSPGTRGSITVSMYSTDVWDISSRKSERYDFTEPETRVRTSEECIPMSGSRGFEIDVTRVFRRPGEEEIHHTETFHTEYVPRPEVICR